MAIFGEIRTMFGRQKVFLSIPNGVKICLIPFQTKIFWQIMNINFFYLAHLRNLRKRVTKFKGFVFSWFSWNWMSTQCIFIKSAPNIVRNENVFLLKEALHLVNNRVLGMNNVKHVLLSSSCYNRHAKNNYCKHMLKRCFLTQYILQRYMPF